MSRTDHLTPALARDRLHYDPVTGALTWRTMVTRQQLAGKPAGCVQKNGYLALYLEGKLRYAHRVIWLMATGEWPYVIDHIDGNKLNNAFSNLRNVDHATNIANRHGARIDSKTGHIGVTEKGGRFYPYIYRNGRKFNVCGGFASAENASAARAKYQQENPNAH